jgi:hypothetical protein
MPAKRKFKLDNFLEVLSLRSMSTGIVARQVKCAMSTALRYLRELKAAKQVIERRISNTINLWKLSGKRIMLIDVDSTIPNLALMKISTYHKARGDNVVLIKIKIRRCKDGSIKQAVKIDLSDKPDKIYASIVYKLNKNVLDDIVAQQQDITFDVGGSGYNLKKTLPEEIENMKPDYSLYPTNDASIGFSSRGCIRNKKTCPFCIVSEKEGKYRRTQHPSEWYNSEFEKITFLDNNILADKEWFMEVTSWCMEKKLEMWFNQGLDIRLLDEEIANRLYKTRNYHHMITFAWDHIEDEAIVKEKIDLLKSVGFTKNMCRAKVQFYVFVDNDEEYESGVYRCRELKKLNCNSYVTYNIDNERSQRIKDLQRWAIRKIFYWINDITDYKANIREAKTVRAKRAKSAKATE